MKRYLAATLLVAAVVSCDETTSNPVTQLNLDRPVDIAFACYGGLRLTGGGPALPEHEIIASAQPLESCNVRSQSADSVPPGQEDSTGSVVGGAQYYAFILQSGPGTVALAKFPTKEKYGPDEVQMQDADGLTPGENGITVGEDPVAIATDRSGCFEVIANAGSCDLSTLEINTIGVLQGSSMDAVVNRMPVKNAAGTVINARPAAMAFEPTGGTIGVACPAVPQGLAYIAYPSCHMVAGVDVSTGTIVTAITFDAAGIPTVVADPTNMTCPSECDGAGMITAGTRPVTLDLEVDGRSQRTLLTIGADNSNLLTIFDLDAAFRPLVTQQVALQNTNGRIGIISTAISPLIGMGGSTGSINDDVSVAGDKQFVYAVTTDGTVRVTEIEGVPRECDTQVDPRYLRDVRDVDLLSCLTVGAMTTPPRRAGARGPGIELTGDAMATSIDVFRVEGIGGEAGINPDYLVGYFGVITAANGRSYVLNIDDDNYPDYVDPAAPIHTQIPLTIAHQLRDDIPQRELIAEEAEVDPNNPEQQRTVLVCDDPGPDPDSQGASAGGPRMVGNIARTVPSGALAPEKYGGLPSIRQVFCDSQASDGEDRPVPELFFSAPIATREEVFPDLRAMAADETWTLTWEGSLSLDSVTSAVDGPAVRESQLFVDGSGLRMVDASRPYCEAGVEPFDILQLRGCDPTLGDAGCPLGYTCYVHPQSQVTGLGSCMLTNEAERLSNACKPFLTSLRRYTIGETKSGELQLLPRKHVLRTTPTTGCIDDVQCDLLEDYAVSNPSSANPRDYSGTEDPREWQCDVDVDRRPGLDSMGQPLKRCIQVCEDDSQCSIGTVCTAHPAARSPNIGYCMEGVIPPQACVNAPQRYELRAGEAFAVIGTRTGFQHPNIADSNGRCVRDPNANPLLAGRIPLKAPPCDPLADPRTGRRMDGTFDANPCTLTVTESEYQLQYVAGSCTLGTPDEIVAARQAPALRLRNRALTLTIVDPTYNGDAACHGDRMGTLVDVPLVMPGYQLAFRQTAGFVPLIIGSITPSFPIKVVRGPRQSIWVIDEGDFLSTSIAQPSTRGRVFRVESIALGVQSTLE